MCRSGRLPRPSAAAVSSPDFRPAFDVLDADRDGKISRDDLKSFYSASVGPTDDDVIASMISAADSDRNGFVDFEEFERVLAGGGGAGGGELGIMEEAFRVMDRDGDGLVGFEDLKKCLEWAGMGLGDEDVRAMIRMGGGDENEGVRLEGLMKILAVDSAAAR